MRRALVVLGFSILTIAAPALAQSTSAGRGTVVIVTAREAMSPIPTLFGGDAANREVSDLLFLRLADLPVLAADTRVRVTIVKMDLLNAVLECRYAGLAEA